MINIKDKLSRFSDLWAPKVIAEMNDTQFKLVKIKGDFVWHQHDHSDEAFIVVHGAMNIHLEAECISLKAGEMYVVPKGVRHKPSASEECHVLLVEPRGVVNTGQAQSELQAPNDVWV